LHHGNENLISLDFIKILYCSKKEIYMYKKIVILRCGKQETANGNKFIESGFSVTFCG